jgi:hypothetical protein
VLGVALLADWSRLADRWAWPLPPLPATILGAWLCTLAAGLLWFSLREKSWANSRIGLIPMMLPLLLNLVAAARLHSGLNDNLATHVYLPGTALLLTLLATVTVIEERRLRPRTNAADSSMPTAASR